MTTIRAHLLFSTALALLFAPALAVAAPFAYVVSGTASGTVSVIDTANNNIVATVPSSGIGPVAVNAAGTRVYVAAYEGLSIIDTATNAIVGKVPFDSYGQIVGVAVNPQGTRAYVPVGEGGMGGDYSVSVIDLTTNTVLAALEFGDFSPVGIAVDPAGSRMYVPVTGWFVPGGAPDAVWVIDAATYALVAKIPVPAGVGKVAMNAAGTRLYVIGNKSISIVDAATNAVVATADVGSIPTAAAVDHASTRVYVATYSKGLLIFDAATLDVVATVPVGNFPAGVAVDPTDRRAYVTNVDSNNVSVVDTATNTVFATILVTAPTSVAVAAAPAGFDLNRRGLTGSWYQPATSGQGVTLEVYEDLVAPGTGYVQGAWFTYDDRAGGGAASQRWYTFSGSAPTGQSSATLTLYQNVGGNFNALPRTSAVPVGSVVLTTTNCYHLTMDYTFTDGSGRSGTTTMERVTPAACSSSSTSANSVIFGYSGNWYDAATSGQGVVLDVTAVNGRPFMFFGWYTYAPNGQTQGEAGQRWYTGQGFYKPGVRTVPLILYETTGGLFDKAAPPPSTLNVGLATVTFTSCSAATLSFNFYDGSNTGASGTINLSRLGPTPAGCGP